MGLIVSSFLLLILSKRHEKGINTYVLRNDIYRIIIEIFSFTQKLFVKGVHEMKNICIESKFS